MDVWKLPVSLKIGGTDYSIRTDFRDVLYALKCFDNPDFTDNEKWIICMKIMFPKWTEIPDCDIEEAIEKVRAFIDYENGYENQEKSGRKLMDWDQDAKILIPSINKVVGQDIRSLPYMHWWTFLSAYMEVGDGAFSTVVSIRDKKARGKKLEKWEREFYTENKSLVDMKKKYTAEEIEEQEKLKALLG